MHGGTHTLTMTMTMAHSKKIPNISQKPGPTDISDGVMTTSIKESVRLEYLAQSARLNSNTL